MVDIIPRTAELMQYPRKTIFPRIAQPAENQCLTLSPMDYKTEIGRRIKACRMEKAWTLAELSLKTGDFLTLKRINAYENGDRMLGPAEAVILAKALGTRPAYIMGLDDVQTPISLQEEKLVRNWRTLSERERMDFFRKIETASMQSRDPAPDAKVERHIPVPERSVARKR